MGEPCLGRKRVGGRVKMELPGVEGKKRGMRRAQTPFLPSLAENRHYYCPGHLFPQGIAHIPASTPSAALAATSFPVSIGSSRIYCTAGAATPGELDCRRKIGSFDVYGGRRSL